MFFLGEKDDITGGWQLTPALTRLFKLSTVR